MQPSLPSKSGEISVDSVPPGAIISVDETMVKLEDGTPAAGKFEGWPNRLKDFKLLDPCCGSGHFLVAAFLLLGLLFNLNSLPINLGYAWLAGWARRRLALVQRAMQVMEGGGIANANGTLGLQLAAAPTITSAGRGRRRDTPDCSRHRGGGGMVSSATANSTAPTGGPLTARTDHGSPAAAVGGHAVRRGRRARPAARTPVRCRRGAAARSR